MEYTVLLKNKYQGILPTTMLSYLVIHNCFVSGVFMEDIADMKYQLHYIHLVKDFIKPKHIKQRIIKISKVCVRITVSLLHNIYICWGRGNIQH